MINRMDNICEAVIKGKWPINRRYVFDFPGNLLPGHASAAAAGAAAAGDSPLQRRSQAELMAGINSLYSASEDKTLSPQLHVRIWPTCVWIESGAVPDGASLMLQEDALSLTVPRQRRRRRRKIEIEAERAAKRRNLMEMVAQLRESHAALESQTQAMDLTKVFTELRV